MSKATLTPKQRRFCEEYAIDCNGTQAAIRAGYSSGTAKEIAFELLTKPHIQDQIQQLTEAISLDCQVTTERVIKELSAIAFSRITDVLEFGPDGVRFKNSSELSPEALAAIESVTITTTTRGGMTTVKTQVKLHNKLEALEKLARRLRLYPKELPVLEAVQTMLVEGVATPEQAQIVRDGIRSIEEQLRGLGG